MANLIAGRRLVPEYVQDAATPEALAAEVGRLLDDPGGLAAIRAGLLDARRSLGPPGAAARAAEAVCAVLEAAPRQPPRPETELSRTRAYRWGGRLGAAVLHLWGATLRTCWEIPESVRALERDGHHMVHAFWHAHILTLAYTHRGRGIVVLVSRHGDGEWISQTIHHLGYGTVRGSSHRGGLRALLEMGQLGRRGYPLSVTPDGPRGPRHVLQPGILLIAQKAGIPIVPYAAGARPCSRLDSWDRFELPHPFARVLVVAGEPIGVPDGISPEELERRFRPAVEAALRAVEARAEAWSRGRERC